MTNKELFQVWAPTTEEKWTRFAKPALFVHANESDGWSSTPNLPSIPTRLSMLEKADTAIIVDLPSATSVESGLMLAKQGYIPVPLYNGIHEKNIGDLEAVVENAPIIQTLQAGVSTLDYAKHMGLFKDATPAFLLDANRSRTPSRPGMYDNRWSIDIDDMPEAQYMRESNIHRVVVWNTGTVSPDLAPILDSYHDMGLEISLFFDGKFVDYRGTSLEGQDPAPPQKTIPDETLLRVQHFENARFALLLLAGMALVNFIFQFFVRGEPILWTTPTLQWLTYLWVPEGVGDLIAMCMVVITIALYFLSQRRRHLIAIATILYGADAVIFFIYVWYYGVSAFMGYELWYGLLVFGLPIFCVYRLIVGTIAQGRLQPMSIQEYDESLLEMDRPGEDSSAPLPLRPRRHFRGFRGYRGYGGSGQGGFGGSGYRGRGGGYGGGFGG